MLPLRGLMVFPHMVLHFDAGRKKSIAALDQAMEENQRIFLVAQRDMDVDDPAIDDIYHVGTHCLRQAGDSVCRAATSACSWRARAARFCAR